MGLVFRQSGLQGTMPFKRQHELLGMFFPCNWLHCLEIKQESEEHKAKGIQTALEHTQSQGKGEGGW